MDKRDYPFISEHFDMDRVEPVLEDCISKLNFKEVCKLYREVAYDMVSYRGDGSPSIYDNEKYSQEAVEQAVYLQRKISTAIDLYEQCITNGRSFNWDYLYDRLGR